MAKRAKIVVPASKDTITEWANGYTIPSISALFQEFSGKVQTAIATDFALNSSEMIANHDLLIITSDDTVGEIEVFFGGDHSNVTPHEFRATTTIAELVEHLLTHGDLDSFAAWRDILMNAAVEIDREIKKNE